MLLCLLGAIRWMLSDAMPGSASTLFSLTVGSASAFLVVLTCATLRGGYRIGTKDATRAGLSGAMLVGGPFVPLLFGIRSLEPASLTMALALTAVVVAVARPAFRPMGSAEVAGRLWPGIAAVAGLLLLLPVPPLDNLANDCALVAAPLLTGVGAMWFRSIAVPKLLRALLGLFAATLAFAASGMVQHALHRPTVREAWLAATLDGALVLLTVLALLRIGGTRWSAQFVLVPLVIVLEGLTMIRVRPDPRMMAGVLVLVFAAVFLLLPPAAQSEGEVSILS
jgi:hypothetical protein